MIRRRILLLSGAHKTASTHLQQTLVGSNPALNKLGISTVGPKDARRDLTPILWLYRDGLTFNVARAAALGFVDHFAQDASTFVLMDENHLGGTVPVFFKDGQDIYPRAPIRLSRVLTLLEGHDIELAFSVRNPATHLPSCWSESLRHGCRRLFSQYVDGLEPTGLMWNGLIDRIRQALPDVPITMWRYEDYNALGPSLFNTLLGRDVADAITMDDKIRRPGLSQEAADWFQAQKVRNREAAAEARKRFPRHGPENAFNPYDPAQITAMTEGYKRDIDVLIARKDVTFLLP